MKTNTTASLLCHIRLISLFLFASTNCSGILSYCFSKSGLLLKKRASSTVSMAPLKTFPPDLAVEILARLPVKSLLRFRCVSKSWDITITDPVFSKLHQTRPCLFISKVETVPFRFTCLSNQALLADSCDGIDDAVTYVHVPWRTSAHRFSDFDVMGCCNGLVCIYSDSTHNLTLWNPSTRKFNTLPPLMRFGGKVPFFCGIGYDKTSDDYKVVKGFIDDVLMDVGDNVFVFSLKSNAWRRIPNSYIGSNVPADCSGVLLGGALHWVAIFGKHIIAFDLAKEKFEVLPHPEIGHSLTEIGVLGEHLCLCSKFVDDRGVDVWIMKEYGLKSSWTKMFRIPHESLSRYESNYVFSPLLYSKEDEIVAMVSGTGVSIVRCNTRDMRFKDIMVWPNDPPAYAFLFMESLVSPLVNHQA